MLTDNYREWAAFTFKGRKFLALGNGRQWHVWGANMQNYGSYGTLKSFKKFYSEQGEALCL